MTVIRGPFGKKLTVKRMTTPGAYIDGMWRDGKWQSFEITASLQPMMERDFLLLPEGDRFKDVRKIYTDAKLLVGNEGRTLASDLVCIDGEDYQVRKVEDWTNHLSLTHFKVILVRDNRNDEPPQAG